MRPLDTNHINIFSPYTVWESGGRYYFESESRLKFFVDFDLDTNPICTAYWLNLVNMSGQASPGDVRVWETMVCIVEEFFRQNPDILLYLCSTEGGQQAQRARLFLRWFNRAGQGNRYCLRAAEVKGEQHTEYVALIARRDHPMLEDILNAFEQEISMFNEQKP